jgi:hypothetical protein
VWPTADLYNPRARSDADLIEEPPGFVSKLLRLLLKPLLLGRFVTEDILLGLRHEQISCVVLRRKTCGGGPRRPPSRRCRRLQRLAGPRVALVWKVIILRAQDQSRQAMRSYAALAATHSRCHQPVSMRGKSLSEDL